MADTKDSTPIRQIPQRGREEIARILRKLALQVETNDLHMEEVDSTVEMHGSRIAVTKIQRGPEKGIVFIRLDLSRVVY